MVDAASSLLSRMPLEDVTTTRIAVEAGISVGALYRFFPDKQTILDAVAVRHVQRFAAVVEKSPSPDRAGDEEPLRLSTGPDAQPGG